MKQIFSSVKETQAFAFALGKTLQGGEVIEFVGDVGAGKTTFVKGLAAGLGVGDDVQSPSFTISRTYKARDDLELHHYDFYRLSDPGIMRFDLAESTDDPHAVTVVEWAETVDQVLPASRIRIHLAYGEGEGERVVTIDPEPEIVKEAYATWSQNR